MESRHSGDEISQMRKQSIYLIEKVPFYKKENYLYALRQ